MEVGFVVVAVVIVIIIIHVQVFLDRILLPAHKLQFHNLNIECKSLQLLEVKFYDQLFDTPVFISTT
jgi:hypothetical protein